MREKLSYGFIVTTCLGQALGYDAELSKPCASYRKQTVGSQRESSISQSPLAQWVDWANKAQDRIGIMQ